MGVWGGGGEWEGMGIDVCVRVFHATRYLEVLGTTTFAASLPRLTTNNPHSPLPTLLYNSHTQHTGSTNARMCPNHSYSSPVLYSGPCSAPTSSSPRQKRPQRRKQRRSLRAKLYPLERQTPSSYSLSSSSSLLLLFVQTTPTHCSRSNRSTRSLKRRAPLFHLPPHTHTLPQ